MSNPSDSSPLDLAAWPSVLALPLRDYQREQQPVVKLWLMCDVVELMLRLAAVVGVAELRAAHGELPADLRAALAGQIHWLTSGQWKSILQQIIRYLPNQSAITQDLNAVFASLANLMDCPVGEVRSVHNSLSTLHNEGLAQGAGVNKELAEQFDAAIHDARLRGPVAKRGQHLRSLAPVAAGKRGSRPRRPRGVAWGVLLLPASPQEAMPTARMWLRLRCAW